MAQARGYVADQHLTGLRRIQLKLGDLEILTYSAKHGGPGLHAPLLLSPARAASGGEIGPASLSCLPP
jgi:hypothetical protein